MTTSITEALAALGLSLTLIAWSGAHWLVPAKRAAIQQGSHVYRGMLDRLSQELDEGMGQ